MGIAAAVAATIAMWPQQARAEYGDVCVEGAPACIANPTKWSFYGNVTDAVGRPIEGALVRNPDDGQGTYTATDGSYRLDYDGPICCTQGSNAVAVSKPGMATTTAYGGTLTGEDDQLDVELLYRAQLRVSPEAVEPGQSPTVSLTARVPEPEIACGFVGYYDHGWHWVVDAMNFDVTESDGTSRWQRQLRPDLVPASGAVAAWVEDCESREVLTNYAQGYYYGTAG